MKLADTIVSMDAPEDFLLDVAMSGNEEVIELLIAALKELDSEPRCFAVLDTITQARRRKDDDALVAANRLFYAVRDR